MKKKSGKILLEKREKNLIQNSSVCDSDFELKAVLSMFSNSININEIEKIKITNSRIYNILRSNDAIKEMIENSSLEWEQEKPSGVKKFPCQLCGNRRSENKYIIRNIINENRLEVGSHCITQFPKMNKAYKGENINIIDKWIKNSPEKLERLSNFSQMYGGGKDILNKWNELYSSFEIEFPNEYDNEFSRILKGGRKIYNGYINGSIQYKDIVKFQDSINDFIYLYNKCKSFERENKTNKYICTKSISSLLEKQKLISTIKAIKDTDCNIKKDFAKYVYDSDFIKRFERQIKHVFEKNKIILGEINRKSIVVKYDHSNFDTILLEISLKEFSKRYYEVYYNDVNYKQEDLLENLSLKDEMKNVENFINILNIILKNSGYYLKFDIDLYSKHNIEIHNRALKKLANINIKELNYKYIKVLHLQTRAKEFLINEINSINKWTTYEELKKYDIGNISSKWTS